MGHYELEPETGAFVDGRGGCAKCGGVLRCERVYTHQGEIPVWRCLQCGEVVDAVILRNRCRPPGRRAKFTRP
jgi:hypothetical protein